MEFFHGIVALVAGIVLILTGLVAWMYIQQSRMAQAINALAVAVTTPPPSFLSHPPVEEPVEQDHEQEQVVDDRVSVHDVDADAEHEHEHEQEEEETGVIGEDISDFTGKTVVQLRDLLTAKGIPYSKSDKKPVLLSLVQAAA
uniref:HeH/LEM domain-containing protein n=1 Tax=viral metagenome TaxID=1070528 RepID=A0A6C0CHH6_9ZZZZ